jgi:hypothetical protein
MAGQRRQGGLPIVRTRRKLGRIRRAGVGDEWMTKVTARYRPASVVSGLMLVVVLASCANDPGFTGVAGIRDATAAEVASCAYVADYRMKPGTYGLLADQGVKYARNRMRSDARSAGANALVFDTVVPGADVYELHATAYRCG